MITKNETIRLHGIETRKKRKSQACAAFSFKIDKSNLSKRQKDCMHMMFVEAKWLYNYLISKSDDPDVDITNALNYKNYYNITHKDKNGNDIEVELTHLGSSVMQGVFDMIRFSIKGLSRLKKNGHKVGKLRFKSECKSLYFKQHKISHSLKGNKLKIQGVPGKVRLLGTKQLEKCKNLDVTTMNLYYDGSDWYAKITCYFDKPIETKHNDCQTYKSIGIDFGCATSLTLSNGEKYDFSFEETDRIKKLQRKLAKQTKMSNNWKKTRIKYQKAWTKLKNKKEDEANKLVHMLSSKYTYVVTQDDNLASWHIKDNEHDKKPQKVQHSILGRVKAKLKRKPNVIFLDKWLPTSKLCVECGHKHENLALEDRIFVCPNCGYVEDRDVHAANNMIWFWQNKIYTGKELAGALPKLFKAEEESTTSLALC